MRTEQNGYDVKGEISELLCSSQGLTMLADDSGTVPTVLIAWGVM
jgi:hypothetical protein